MTKLIFFLGLLGTCLAAQAQPKTSYQPAYHFIQSGNRVADKNFYLLTVIQQRAELRQLLGQDATLQALCQQRASLIKAHAKDTCRTPASLVTGFRWSGADSLRMVSALQTLYDQHPALFDKLANEHLRPSGYYQRFVRLSNRELLARAWGQYIAGTNYIIDQFGLGKKMRYPRIDSANYPVNGRYYRTVLKDMFAMLAERTDSMTLFYQPSLSVAMQLMDANDRDEPARHEPMEQLENKGAFLAAKKTRWAAYKYAAILIPGSGPELATTPLSPLNKMRLDMVATRYKNGWAPFIIVSGGYCYPFRGPYAEALEMKTYLMRKFGIPASAIVIDPHARHTTTNFRNAARLMIRYGFPTDKRCLMVSTKSQTDMVANPAFDARNRRELGYLPYREKQRLSDHDIEFSPTLESLHMDPYDPLDP